MVARPRAGRKPSIAPRIRPIRGRAGRVEAEVRRIARWLLAAAMTAVGALHFVLTPAFAHIVPAWLPHAVALVLVSGACEIAGGVGLLIPRTRRAASLGLVALYVAVFPANVNMVAHPALGGALPLWALWARLPLQILFIAWALWVGRDAPATPSTTVD